MYLDLHAHSVSSDDSRATVEQYVKWTSVLRRKGRKINGFVLTEHRGFDFGKDYRKLGTDNDVLILKGSELDTNIGHFLRRSISSLLARISLRDWPLRSTDIRPALCFNGWLPALWWG